MQLNELDQLAAEAAADTLTQADADPASAVQPDPVKLDTAQELTALISVVSGILTPAFPGLKKIYTPETCTALGAAAAPVFDKHGWSAGGIFDRWGAEISLAAVAVPVSIATWQAVKQDLADKKHAPDQAHVENAQSVNQTVNQPTEGTLPAVVIERG